MIQRRRIAPVRAMRKSSSSSTAPVESLEKRQLFAAQLLLPTTVEINEDAGTITVLMALSEPAPVGGASVDYTTVEGTAEAGDDYTTRIGVVEFAEGETGGQVVIPIAYDDKVEQTETFSLRFFNGDGVDLSNNEGGDPAVTIQILDVPGGDDGGGNNDAGVNVSVVDAGFTYRGNTIVGGETRGRATATIVNEGDVTIDGPYTVTFYGVMQSAMDEVFIELGSKRISSDLRPGRDRDVTLDFTFPTSAGEDFRLQAKLLLNEEQAADNAGALSDDSDTSVNIPATFADMIATDLDVKYKGASAIGDQTKGTAELEIAYEGTTTYRGPITVNFYASTDGTIDDGDTLFASVEKNVSLRNGRDTSVKASFVFPDVTDGGYTILARIEPVNAESDSANNDVAAPEPVTIAAPFVDLTADELDLKYKGAPAAVIGDLTKGTATVTVSNGGNITYKGPVTVTFYASADGTLDENDIAFGQAEKNVSLKSGRSTTIKATGVFPDVPDGDYLIIADVSPVDGETNADGNAVAYPEFVTIAAPFVDLTAQFTLVPETLTIGGRSARTSLEVVNLGNTTADGELPVSYYLSTDEVLDEGDYEIGQVSLNGRLKAGDDTAVRVSIPAPEEGTIEAGDYFLVAVLNDGGEIVESTTDNNVIFSEQTITVEL